MIPPNDDSSAIRGSILDVCLQLGALDSNNPIAHWMFSDGASSSQQTEEGNWNGSRFHERLSQSLQLEDKAVSYIEEHPPRFSSVRFKPASKSKSKLNTESHLESAHDEHAIRRETRLSSLLSFFGWASAQRSEHGHHDNNICAYDNGGSPAPPTNTRPLFQPNLLFGAERLAVPSVDGNSSPMPISPLSLSYGTNSMATPIIQTAPNNDDQNGDSYSDDEWEQVDIRPQSILYALRHLNRPPPPRRLKKKRRVSAEQSARTESDSTEEILHTFSCTFPRPSKSKTRKSTPRPLAVYPSSNTESHRSYSRARSLSTPAPLSSLILDTPHSTHSTNTSLDLPREPLLEHRPSMGYHNQFFVRDQSQPPTPKPLPSLPPTLSSSHRIRRVSFTPLGVRHPTPLLDIS